MFTSTATWATAAQTLEVTTTLKERRTARPVTRIGRFHESAINRHTAIYCFARRAVKPD